MIRPEIATHEAGHLVVGHYLGLDEMGIVFASTKPNELAGAWFRSPDKNPKEAVVRALAGLLAHLHLLPKTIQPHLCKAYEHSIIIDGEHPHYHHLTAEERQFLSGAETDLSMAWNYALKVYPKNSAKARSYMFKAENNARALIVKHANDITRIVEDIAVWANEPDRQWDGIPIYPYSRAKSVIERSV